MRKSALFLIVALPLMASGGHVLAAEKTNAELTPEQRIAEGGEDFRTYCATCHGQDAKGDGPMAAELKTPPADLTVIAREAGGQFPAEDVKAYVDGRDMPRAHGTSEMPVWGSWFSFVAEARSMLEDGQTKEDAEKMVDERLDRLMDYLQSIQQ